MEKLYEQGVLPFIFSTDEKIIRVSPSKSKKLCTDNINHSGLPFYSNTSDFYVKISEEDGQPEQIRIFKNRRALLDLDWNHPHPPFKKGELHIHECVFDKNGHPRRLSPRAATPDEIKKYRALIKKVNPTVKF